MRDNNRLLKLAWGVAALVFIIQFTPYILRPDVYIRIHDTLEGEWMWYGAIVDNGVALNYDMAATVDSWFGGIPRYLFPTGLSLTTFFIYLFGTVGGYLVSSFLIDLTAFIGCFLLFRQYVFTRSEDAHWPVLIGALYSIIPFFATFGISIAGLPLLLLAFLNILKRRAHIWEYALIILFPFYSNIVWSILFINGMLLIVFAAAGRKQIGKLPFFGMLLLMNLVYAAVNIHLIYAMFVSDIALHRETYDPLANQSRSLLRSIGETAYLFFANHYHIGTMVNLPILLLAMLAFSSRAVKWLLGLAVLIAVLNGFYLWLVPVLDDIHPMLISFRITRVKMLLPFIWMGILAFSIRELSSDFRGVKLSLFVLGALLVSTLFANDEILNNYRNWFGFNRKPDAREFFDRPTWSDIDSFIGRDKDEYRIAHLGLNPAISQFNGFRTIDGLQAIYPLEHKQFMAEVMRGELEKDEKLARYFNAWGNRCYLFSSELGKEHAAFMIDRSRRVAVEEWEIDTELLKTGGVDYIFSAAEIRNSAALSLKLERAFEREGGFWRVYLYRIE